MCQWSHLPKPLSAGAGVGRKAEIKPRSRFVKGNLFMVAAKTKDMNDTMGAAPQLKSLLTSSHIMQNVNWYFLPILHLFMFVYSHYFFTQTTYFSDLDLR